MLTQIHHKKNELQEVEFYQDKECTEAFDFTGKMQLYLQEDITILLELLATHQVEPEAEIFVPKLPNLWYELSMKCLSSSDIKTLDDITPNLSKYIPEDNAVLFLSGEKLSLLDYDDYYDIFSGYRDIEFEGKIIEGMPYHPQIYGIHTIGDRVSVHKHEYGIDDYTNFTLNILKGKKLTIFLPHGTQSELQKANEVAKELKEKHGVEEVNLFAKDWFLPRCEKYYEEEPIPEWFEDFIKIYDEFFVENNIDNKDAFNKIITTNSTGILPVQDTERLQVIDCKEIFEEYLKENN